MIKLYHPDLNQTIEVAEASARIYERSGWIKQETTDEEARFFIASAGLTDTDTNEEPAPQEQTEPELEL